MSDQQYHHLSAEETLRRLQTSQEGLTDTQVQDRQNTYGPNVLPEAKKTSLWVLFLRQFKSFLIIILLIAAGVSFSLEHPSDAYIILAAVLLNVIVGFFQENKAENALDALRHVITLEATVIRNGKEAIINVREVVPGDIVLIDSGDKVPADARVIKMTDLQANESALTGESVAVDKQLAPVEKDASVGDRACMVFTGTTITNGSATAVVVATGVQTEIGRIADLLHNTKTESTPLQKKLDHFARQIGILVILVSVGIFAVGYFKGIEFVDIFTTAVAVAVSAIPEGLVVAVTIILAIGMQRILKRNALVRNLQAAETLGSTSVICTDKTGTLTEGNMQVVTLVTHDMQIDGLHTTDRHHTERLHEMMFALNIGMLCNDAHIVKTNGDETTIVGDFTERALVTAGMSLGVDKKALEEGEPRVSSVPFNSTQKFMATLHEHPIIGRRMYVKGAPEKLLAMSSHVRAGEKTEIFSEKQKKEFNEQFIAYSEQGLRILALAYKDMSAQTTDITSEDVKGLTFVGFVGIKDPLRPKIIETFQVTEKAGIRTVMITGDHKITAKAIATELGLPTQEHNIIEGDELRKLSKAELTERVKDISVYARVSPEDKLNIVHAWKANDMVIAMTGDGVNDSPALKAADIGVALGSGTDVAKEGADIVLLEDNFETIVAAVEEGRGIFDNIRKVVLYLVSDSFSEVLLVTAAILLSIPVPLTAAQILWINLVADGLPNIALTVDPKDEEIMEEKPRSIHEPVMDTEMKVLVAIISVITGIGNLVIFWYFWRTTGNIELARSVVFATLAVDSLLYVFSVRSMRHTIFHRNTFSNSWLLLSVVAAFCIQLAAFYIDPLAKLLQTVPLGWFEWGVVFATSTVVILIIEFVKYLFIVSRKKHNA